MMIFPFPTRGTIGWVLLLTSAWIVTASDLRAEEICDPGLTHETEDPRAYRQRGDRCEGLYRLKVNSDKLRLRSWTLEYEPYDPVRPLELGWVVPPESDGAVHLRATALKADIYFRMDTLLAAGDATWTWKTSFLEQLGLQRPDLGLVAWTRSPTDPMANAGETPVYLPLTVHQGTRPQGSAGYRVILVPGERLLEVSWTLSPVGGDGIPGAPLTAPVPLGFGYYPARRPTELSIPAPDAPGIYVLTLTADLLNKAPAIRQIWFYNPRATAVTHSTPTPSGSQR